MAPLLGLPRLLADYGLDAEAEIRSLGCDPALFREPENTIDFAAVGRLLAHTAAVTGCPWPGLELGRHLGLDTLGVVGETIRLAPDVGTALRALTLELHLHDRGAIPYLSEGEQRTLFGYTVYWADVPGIDHVYDVALAVAYNVIAELAGKGWRAAEIRMYRAKPRDITPYLRHFRAPLRFESERSAIVFPSADLARLPPDADPLAYAQALRNLRELDASTGTDLAGRVHRVLDRLFISGHGPEGIDLPKVARLFALHPRTLNRRLRAEGTTFNALLAQARYEIARQLLRDTRLQLGEIATALGYADASAFIHAFRRWSGTTPSAWRSRHSPA